MKIVLFTVLLTLGLSTTAASRFDEVCAQIGDTAVNRMFLDQLKGHVEGNDYIVTFVPTELQCKGGVATEIPTNLKFVSLIDNDYQDSFDSGNNPYKLVPQVSKENIHGQLVVTVRFANGVQDLFSGPEKTERRFFTSIGFWFRTYSFYLIISKNNPVHPSLVLAQ